MSFLAPWWLPALAAGLAVPPLVLLYFLKLKRRELPIASTLLWKRAVQDLQVNSPFQRLRKNLLLFLQLLVLAAAILAICEPVRKGQRAFEKTIVLLIDRSASMAADEGDGQTRLAIARQEALRTIDALELDQRAMVIAFADRATVLSPFTDDKRQLRAAVESVQQSDAAGSLREAMTLAEAHSTPLGEFLGSPTNQVSRSQYLLFTDGRLPDSQEVRVQRGALEVVRVGQTTDNVGIVNLDVRRNYERPEQLSVLARVRNFGTQPVSRDLSLFVDGELKHVQSAGTLAPLGSADKLATMASGGVIPDGSEVTVPFELLLDSAAQIEVRLSGSDALPVDDRAWAIATPPKSLSVLLVTPGNRFLRQILDALPLHHREVWSPEEYESAPEDKLTVEGRCRFDVVILDGHSTGRFPPGSYMFFASAPLVEGVDVGEDVQGEVFLDWDETHPILRHVSIEAILVLSWRQLKLPDNAVPLIEGPDAPVMALLTRGRQQFLITAFGIFNEQRSRLNTDWVDHEGFVVFFYNAFRYLTGSSSVGQLASVAPGEAFTVAARPGISRVLVRRPDGREDRVEVRNDRLAAYGATDKVGVYRLEGSVSGEEARAVNLLSDDESLIAPNRDFRIASGELTSTQGIEQSNRPLWSYALMVAGLLLLVEWVIYNKRVFV